MSKLDWKRVGKFVVGVVMIAINATALIQRWPPFVNPTVDGIVTVLGIMGATSWIGDSLRSESEKV